MDIVWIIILVLLTYLATVILLSTIRALATRKKGKDVAKEVFKETFWDFFIELLNPFNWI